MVIKRILFMVCLFLIVSPIVYSLTITPISPKGNSVISENSALLYPCPEESKPPVKSQACEVKKGTIIKQNQSNPIKALSSTMQITNQTKKPEIIAMATGEVKTKSSLLASVISIFIVAILAILIYYKFFRLKK